MGFNYIQKDNKNHKIFTNYLSLLKNKLNTWNIYKLNKVSKNIIIKKLSKHLQENILIIP